MDFILWILIALFVANMLVVAFLYWRGKKMETADPGVKFPDDIFAYDPETDFDENSPYDPATDFDPALPEPPYNAKIEPGAVVVSRRYRDRKTGRLAKKGAPGAVLELHYVNRRGEGDGREAKRIQKKKAKA